MYFSNSIKKNFKLSATFYFLHWKYCQLHIKYSNVIKNLWHYSWSTLSRLKLRRVFRVNVKIISYICFSFNFVLFGIKHGVNSQMSWSTFIPAIKITRLNLKNTCHRSVYINQRLSLKKVRINFFVKNMCRSQSLKSTCNSTNLARRWNKLFFIFHFRFYLFAKRILFNN